MMNNWKMYLEHETLFHSYKPSQYVEKEFKNKKCKFFHFWKDSIILGFVEKDSFFTDGVGTQLLQGYFYHINRSDLVSPTQLDVPYTLTVVLNVKASWPDEKQLLAGLIFDSYHFQTTCLRIIP